ncbi:MAG: formate dehydrogenase accessory sulfurtransferase FdhD [Bacillota bacterium]|nr:formate dehydrogenase accessory sulfurtransferase FdhD [Bacillota bacterium]
MERAPDPAVREFVASRSVLKVGPEGARREEDWLLAEVPLTLILNGREFVTLLCTPQHVEDLLRGFLFSEGLITRREDLTSLRLRENGQVAEVETAGGGAALGEKLFGKRTVTTGCGRGTIFYHVSDALQTRKLTWAGRVSAAAVSELARFWQERTRLFLLTGCAHSAALCTPAGEVLAVREDIGRHNAVDKVIGCALAEGWALEDKLLFTTGRISSEILIKAAKARIPVLASHSAPTELAVAFGEELGVTILGFVRGRRMNVYTHPERVALE